MLTWSHSTHPNKAKCREAVFGAFRENHSSILMMPSSAAMCVKTALQQSCISVESDAVFVERDLDVFPRMKTACEEVGFHKAIYLLQSLEDVKVEHTYDLAYIDLCGLMNVQLARWLYSYLIPRLRPGADFAITIFDTARGGGIPFPKRLYGFFRANKERKQYVYEFSQRIGVSKDHALTYLMFFDHLFAGHQVSVLEPLLHRDIGPCTMVTLRLSNIRPLKADSGIPPFVEELRSMVFEDSERISCMRKNRLSSGIQSLAALKAWRTRREMAARRSAAAHKAWQTRREQTSTRR